jgi:hypothetical protein
MASSKRRRCADPCKRRLPTTVDQPLTVTSTPIALPILFAQFALKVGSESTFARLTWMAIVEEISAMSGAFSLALAASAWAVASRMTCFATSVSSAEKISV